MLSSCMGQKECNVVVNSMDIPACNRLGDYVQVEYECVQGTINILLLIYSTYCRAYIRSKISCRPVL